MRQPLPPDLRKQMKAELRKLRGRQASEIGRARQVCASKVADAKAERRDAERKATREFNEARRLTVAAYETRASARTVAELAGA